jgi:hypothetical protein
VGGKQQQTSIQHPTKIQRAETKQNTTQHTFRVRSKTLKSASLTSVSLSRNSALSRAFWRLSSDTSISATCIFKESEARSFVRSLRRVCIRFGSFNSFLEGSRELRRGGVGEGRKGYVERLNIYIRREKDRDR